MSTDMIHSESLWNGWNGNECVYKNEFKKAIDFYNNAIDLYPLEYRYFVNRSYCFDQMKEFESALEDAQKAIMLNKDWGKCHFRKGRALKGLNKLDEAEDAFMRVLQLEGNSQEVHKELISIRRLAQMDRNLKQSNDPNRMSQRISHSVNANKRTEQLQTEDKSDKHKAKPKKSNRGNASVAKYKDNRFGHQQGFSRPQNNIRCDKFYTERNRNNFNASSDSKVDHKVIRDESIEAKSRSNQLPSNEDTNILKKLSDILLNNNDISESTQINDESPDLKNPIISEESPVEDNKSVKSVKSTNSGSNVSYEVKPRFNYNKNNRNAKKTNHNSNMDQIVEIWEDSHQRSVTYDSSKSDKIIESEPTNPWRFKGLWVSNIITSDITKNKLYEIFSKFGKITFFSLIPHSQTAIINFDNSESPRLAMAKLQGVHLSTICMENQRLSIKFRPLNDNRNYPSLSGINERQLNNECYFWRTTGCNHYKYCSQKHIPVNKGVDFQPWMQHYKGRQQRQRMGRI